MREILHEEYAKRIQFLKSRFAAGWYLVCLLAGACQLTYQPQPYPVDFVRANEVVSGICFEAAYDAAGQVFVLRDTEDHIRFYDLADNSQLCRRPVERTPFDFDGRILAGLWSRGTGCTARYDILDVTRDDTAQAITFRLDFVTAGDCNYELLRPFWVALDGVKDYDVRIEVTARHESPGHVTPGQ